MTHEFHFHTSLKSDCLPRLCTHMNDIYIGWFRNYGKKLGGLQLTKYKKKFSWGRGIIDTKKTHKDRNKKHCLLTILMQSASQQSLQ